MDKIIRKLIDFAAKNKNIKAAVLQGSRANPNGAVDKYSDYDIMYITSENTPFVKEGFIKDFAANFGEIAIMQTPDDEKLWADAHDKNLHYAYLIQFKSGLRIDLSFEPLHCAENQNFECASVLLIDKDKIFADFPAAKDYTVKRPTESEFRACCNEFWWLVPYAAKASTRGQLLHTAHIINDCIRPEYEKMLCWRCAEKYGFNINFGKSNYKMLETADDKYKKSLLRSFTIADLSQMKSSYKLLARAFHSLASETAAKLGYAYIGLEGQEVLKLIEGEFFENNDN